MNEEKKVKMNIFRHCQDCGVPVIDPAYHHCHGWGAVPPDAIVHDYPQTQLDEMTTETMEALYDVAMQSCLNHIKNCSSCRYLAQINEVCTRMKELRSIRDKRLIDKVMVW